MFRYSLNASTIRTTPILEKIRIAGEVGYAAIELWHDEIEQYILQGGRLSDIHEALTEQQLELATTIYVRNWCDTTGEAHRQSLTECERRFADAAELGAISVIASPARGAVDVNLAAANYAELVELGLQYGVRPAMEYLGFVALINTVESALEIMQMSGHPEASIIVDPFHSFRGGGSFASLLKLRGDQIAISHFNDAPANPSRLQQHDCHRVLPGDGHLDLQSWVRYLKAIGYDRCLSLELFHEELWQQDPRAVARRGLEAMRAVVESSG